MELVSQSLVFLTEQRLHVILSEQVSVSVF